MFIPDSINWLMRKQYKLSHLRNLNQVSIISSDLTCHSWICENCVMFGIGRRFWICERRNSITLIRLTRFINHPIEKALLFGQVSQEDIVWYPPFTILLTVARHLGSWFFCKKFDYSFVSRIHIATLFDPFIVSFRWTSPFSLYLHRSFPLFVSFVPLLKTHHPKILNKKKDLFFKLLLVEYFRVYWM